MINLIELYKKLKKPEGLPSNDSPAFSAIPITNYPKHRLAKDSSNFPCLLIAPEEAVYANRPAPIRLEHLMVLFDVDCKISHNGQYEKNKFTVICCSDPDQQMQDYFLRIGGTIISLLGKNPSRYDISKSVDKLVELFRSISKAPRKSVQGLWSELFIIHQSTNPAELVNAWHQSPMDKYDFNADNQRIEVKSATSRLRQHYFSLEQLSTPDDIDVTVASLFVERVGTGVSIIELTEDIRLKINQKPDLLLYLDQVIGLTLGNNWQSAGKDKFDYKLAKKSLFFYSIKDIPKIECELPKEISNVHFMADLTNIKGMDKKSMKSKDGIFKAVSSR